MATGLQAIFWDVDGTLAETELEGHRPAFNAAFAEAGLPWRWDRSTYLQLLAVGGGRERIASYLSAVEGEPPSPTRLDSLVAAKQRHYAGLVGGGAIPLRDGVDRLLRAANAAGLTQLIVTTSSRLAVQALMAGSMGTDANVFSGWICGDDVARKKPDSEAYRRALEQTALAPQRVVVVEDSVQGLAAARGAQLTTLVTLSALSRHQASDSLATAAAVVDGLGTTERPATLVRGPACPGGIVTLSWLERLLSMP